jgi:ankyrin repeat protein
MNSSFAKSFSSYARAYWFRHCQEAKQSADTAEHGSSSSVKRLEKLISDGTDHQNPDLLRNAIRLGNDQDVEKAIAANVDLEVPDEFRNTALHDAVRWNHLGILERLVDVGANLNIQNRNGDSPLHFAAFCGFAEVLQALVSAGANRNIVNHKGETPLHIAVIHNHRELARILRT